MLPVCSKLIYILLTGPSIKVNCNISVYSLEDNFFYQNFSIFNNLG